MGIVGFSDRPRSDTISAPRRREGKQQTPIFARHKRCQDVNANPCLLTFRLKCKAINWKFKFVYFYRGWNRTRKPRYIDKRRKYRIYSCVHSIRHIITFTFDLIYKKNIYIYIHMYIGRKLRFNLNKKLNFFGSYSRKRRRN